MTTIGLGIAGSSVQLFDDSEESAQEQRVAGQSVATATRTPASQGAQEKSDPLVAVLGRQWAEVTRLQGKKIVLYSGIDTKDLPERYCYRRLTEPPDPSELRGKAAHDFRDLVEKGMELVIRYMPGNNGGGHDFGIFLKVPQLGD